MNSKWTCDKCDMEYKTLNGFKKHICKKNREDIEKGPVKKERKRKKKDFTACKM